MSKIKYIFKKIPKLPLSVLVFYGTVVILRKLGLIPNPQNIFVFLEGLYQSYGLVGLFMVSFLEGIVYFGLYFPGSFIIALAVVLSDGSLHSLLMISLIVALALTTTSVINYFLGKKIVSSKRKQKYHTTHKHIISKELFVSMLHPNTLALYFFNSGIKNHNFLKILFVPLIMIPYGLALGYVFYAMKEPIKSAAESHYVVFAFIVLRMIVAFIVDIKNKKKEIHCNLKIK